MVIVSKMKKKRKFWISFVAHLRRFMLLSNSVKCCKWKEIQSTLIELNLIALTVGDIFLAFLNNCIVFLRNCGVCVIL